MSEQNGDPVTEALARLEAAVDRLGRAVERRKTMPLPSEGDVVPKAAVAALAQRLDETIARLRDTLGEEG